MKGMRFLLPAAMFFISLFSVNSIAATVVQTCKPVAVADYVGSRVHMQCNQSYANNPAIIFFAMPNITSDDIQRVNQLISIASTALASGKTVGVLFDDADTSGTAFGCGANDCRKAQAIFLHAN